MRMLGSVCSILVCDFTRQSRRGRPVAVAEETRKLANPAKVLFIGLDAGDPGRLAAT